MGIKIKKVFQTAKDNRRRRIRKEDVVDVRSNVTGIKSRASFVKERHMISAQWDNKYYSFKYYKRVTRDGIGYVLMNNDPQFVSTCPNESSAEILGSIVLKIFERGINYYEPDLLAKWNEPDFSENNTKNTPVPSEDDSPVPFGHKMAWYTIRASSPESVIEKMGLKKIKPCDWKEGIETIYENSEQIFITPTTDGWVLAIGYPFDSIDARYVSLFEDLQYYCTHSTVEYHIWAKYSGGSVVRAYAFLGETGEVEMNEGELTSEEKSLGFAELPISTEMVYSDSYPRIPEEEDVLNIAAAWGVDPSFNTPVVCEGNGYLCYL